MKVASETGSGEGGRAAALTGVRPVLVARTGKPEAWDRGGRVWGRHPAGREAGGVLVETVAGTPMI